MFASSMNVTDISFGALLSPSSVSRDSQVRYSSSLQKYGRRSWSAIGRPVSV